MTCICSSPNKNLLQAAPGQRVKIQKLNGEQAHCERLREMGFCESAVVEKISASGALICRVCDAKVILSQRLAENVIVKDLCMCEAHSMKSTALSGMKTGETGVIEGFNRQGEGCERLEEMGLTPGERVEVVRYAPLGDPIEIRIRGYLLSLRRQEADLVQVKLTA